MNHISALTAQRAAWPRIPASPAQTARRSSSPAALLDIIKVWEERKRFRLELQEMAMTAPHLIGDIGLTKEELEAEIAKPFWRA